MSQIPSDRYQSADVMMLPPREEWTKRFLEQREKQRKDGSTKNVSVSSFYILNMHQVIVEKEGLFLNLNLGLQKVQQ